MQKWITISTHTLHCKSLGMGRLDDRLYLIRWVSGSIFILLQGMVVLATNCILLTELPFSVSCYPLSGGPWSQQPGDCVRPWFWVCTGYTHLIRALQCWASWHMFIHSWIILCRFTSLTILWLSPSVIYILFTLYICVYIMLFLWFHYPSFVHMLNRIWDPAFACPDLDPMTTPSEED